MRICVISDIHGYLPSINECDVLCICGDILPLDIQRITRASLDWLKTEFLDWTKQIPAKHVVMIWGNHDFVGERTMEEGVSQSELIFGPNDFIHILNDELKEIDGVKFYGTPWCPNLYNWAFYKPSLELTEAFNKIPEDTNILLTHCPPMYGQQGIVLQECWNQFRNFGCPELQEAIITKFGGKEEDTYVFSGHIHSGNHDFEIMNNVYYRNVSIKDEEYQATYSPFYFDYEKES